MRILKHSLALYISIATLAITGASVIAYACADYDWESTYVSFFHKNLSDAPNTEPFYLSDMLLFQDEPFEKEDTPNMKEWRAYTNGKASEDDIRYIMFKGNFPMVERVQMLASGKVKPLPDSLKRNTFIKYAIDKKDNDLLSYLSYAMQCQSLVNLTLYDMWDYKAPEESVITSLLKKGEEGYAKTKSPFLKMRWGFQMARLAHYNGRYAQCISYCDDLIAPIKTSSEVHSWALSLKAGAFCKTDRKSEGIYLFSRVFDSCPKYRLQAYNSFRHNDNSTIDGALTLCKNDHEKAVLWAMRGYNTFANTPQLLSTIAKLDVTLPDLEVLLVREINKIELAAKSPTSYCDTNATEVAQKTRLIDSLSTLMQPIVVDIAQNKQTPTPSLWYSASSYLHFLNKEYKQAKEMADKADNANPTEKVKGQIAIVRLLVEINENPTLSTESDRIIAQSLKWLREKMLKENEKHQDYYGYYDTMYYTRTFQSIASEVLAKKYRSQNNIPMAVLCQNLSNGTEALRYSYYTIGEYVDNNATIADIEALKTLIAKKDKSPLEEFLTTNAPISRNRLNELIGTKYLRAYSFAKAKEYFQKLPPSFWSKDPMSDYLKVDPFAENDGTRKGTKPKTYFNKLTFAQKMIEYTQLAKQPGDKGAYYTYLLANAYYNISHAGNAWAMVQYSWSGSEYYQMYNGISGDSHKADYFKAITAMSLYQKAASLSKNREMKARCLFQASKCFAMQANAWEWTNGYEKLVRGPYLESNSFFYELKKSYRDTKYYKEVYARCSYLQDYVARK